MRMGVQQLRGCPLSEHCSMVWVTLTDFTMESHEKLLYIFKGRNGDAHLLRWVRKGQTNFVGMWAHCTCEALQWVWQATESRSKRNQGPTAPHTDSYVNGDKSDAKNDVRTYN